MDRIRSLIKAVPDFPKPGILFRDITPVLADASAFRRVTELFVARYVGRGITHLVGIESRGFIFAAALAPALDAGLVLARKPGKLPRPTREARYALEYGENTLHMHVGDLSAGDRVVIVDDLIATGGTAKAAVELVRGAGAEVDSVAVMIELEALGGRRQLPNVEVFTLLTY